MGAPRPRAGATSLDGRGLAHVLQVLGAPGSRTMIGFDFDGTLAPIVARPDAAVMRESTAQLFKTVCLLFPVVVISGRGRLDVAGRLRGAKVKAVVGNHGLEPGGDLVKARREVAAARVALVGLADVDVEDKRYSLAAHYRRAANRPRARLGILRALGALRRPMRVIHGKCVVNVLPAEAPNKGDAVKRLRNRFGARHVLYIGDDVTDEDVFGLPKRERVIGVKVGAARASKAAYFVAAQRNIDSVLATLIALRRGETA